MVLYGIVDFTPTKFNVKNKDTSIGYAKKAGSQRNEMSFTNSIAENSKNVKDDGKVQNMLDLSGMDSDYLKAVEDGDTETAQRMVDDVDNLVEEYGEIDKGFDPQRDIKVPKKTSTSARLFCFKLKNKWYLCGTK